MVSKQDTPGAAYDISVYIVHVNFMECRTPTLTDVVLWFCGFEMFHKQDTHGAAYDTPVSIVHVNIMECKTLHGVVLWL